MDEEACLIEKVSNPRPYEPLLVFYSHNLIRGVGDKKSEISIYVVAMELTK